MKIRSIYIDNFKSLIDFKLIEPNPFSVFVGPNGSGKSNIFEALEFLNYSASTIKDQKVEDLFGGYKNFINLKGYKRHLKIEIKSEHNYFKFFREPYESDSTNRIVASGSSIPWKGNQDKTEPLILEYEQIAENFSRIFVGNENLRKQNTFPDTLLNIDASNLENVLKRILDNSNTKEDIIEWLQIFVPEFEKIEIHTSALSGKNELAIFEKSINQPLTKKLISDGNYNILALLTAVFQSDKPQFICIEEPENGLNPFVVKKLVGLFREACETKGHYIWINTHSQTLVNQLNPEELILVNKKEGATTIKQLKGTNLHGLDMDEAWLSNALGGGVPW